jgi:hypothetical protein
MASRRGLANFDQQRQAWQIVYAMDDVPWEPRKP